MRPRSLSSVTTLRPSLSRRPSPFEEEIKPRPDLSLRSPPDSAHSILTRLIYPGNNAIRSQLFHCYYLLDELLLDTENAPPQTLDTFFAAWASTREALVQHAYAASRLYKAVAPKHFRRMASQWPTAIDTKEFNRQLDRIKQISAAISATAAKRGQFSTVLIATWATKAMGPVREIAMFFVRFEHTIASALQTRYHANIATVEVKFWQILASRVVPNPLDVKLDQKIRQVTAATTKPGKRSRALYPKAISIRTDKPPFSSLDREDGAIRSVSFQTVTIPSL